MSFPLKMTARNWFPIRLFTENKCHCHFSGCEGSRWVVIFWSFLFTAVERYNPQENRWHTIAPMGTRRKHLGCAVYQDMIYAVGGRDDTTELSSAERYNPRTNQWSPVVAMTSRRSGVSAAAESLELENKHWWGVGVQKECSELWATLGHWGGDVLILISIASAVRMLLGKTRGENPKPKSLYFFWLLFTAVAKYFPSIHIFNCVVVFYCLCSISYFSGRYLSYISSTPLFNFCILALTIPM